MRKQLFQLVCINTNIIYMKSTVYRPIMGQNLA